MKLFQYTSRKPCQLLVSTTRIPCRKHLRHVDRQCYRYLTSTSPLAVKRARKPLNQRTATANTPGSILHFEEALTSKGINDPQQGWTISYELRLETLKLGFEDAPMALNTAKLLAFMAERVSPQHAFRHIMTQTKFLNNLVASKKLLAHDAKLLCNPKILCKMMHLIARDDFANANRDTAEGEHILRMLTHEGYEEALIDTVSAEIIRGIGKLATADLGYRPGFFCSPQHRAKLKVRADNDNDWRAAIVYLSEMNRKKLNLDEAQETYEDAKWLTDMLEPASQSRASVECPLDALPAPWLILYEAAEEYRVQLARSRGYETDPKRGRNDDLYTQVNADIEMAIRDGLYKYTDIQAVKYALNRDTILTIGAQEWLDFVTRAAGSGDTAAATALAFHYLREDGMWPSEKAPTRRTISWLGIEWLAVSAALSAPDATTMFAKFVGMAHLLREHGYEAEGEAWLEEAKNVIADAGLDPQKQWEKELSQIRKDWKDEATEQWIHPSKTFLEQFEVAKPALRRPDNG